MPVEYSYTSIPLSALYSKAIPLLPSVPCTVQLYLYTPSVPCTVQLHLYSPQYLYSTAITLFPSVPVQYSYTSTPLSALYNTAISLLPSVPVQFSYSSTHPKGRRACTEPQCLYSTAIPLPPLWAERPVKTLSACTVQLYLYTPMGRTDCTDHQCLYSRPITLLPL